MRHPGFSLPVAALLLLVVPLALQAQEPPKVVFPAASPAATVRQRVGVTDVEVEYSRPSKNGREIFGGLVPFGEVWRTGANASTKITFSDAVILGGTEVPAGKYALYTIPTAGDWTVILYKDLKLWGAYKYKQADDFARFTVKPTTVATPEEMFAISFDDVKEDGATMCLAWDKIRVPVKLAVNTNATVMAAIAKATAPGVEPAPSPQLLGQCANYYFTHGGDLTKALGLMDSAIEKLTASKAKSPPLYSFYERKALMQSKTGDKPGALTSAQKAMELAKADPETSDAETLAGLQKLIDGQR